MQQIEAHTREIAVHIETIAINFSKFFLQAYYPLLLLFNIIKGIACERKSN